MAEITIVLSDEHLGEIRKMAAASGISAEEFLRRCIDQWLAQSEHDFAQAAAYVLQKNAELYRRLA